MMRSKERFMDGASLLVSNYEQGDFKVLANLLSLSISPDVVHDLELSIKNILERNLTAEAEESLLLLYEIDPCSTCRTSFIRFLLRLGRMPDWMRLECRYDADPETVQAVLMPSDRN